MARSVSVGGFDFKEVKMRSCEYCGGAVDDATNKCTACGATQSTSPPAPAPAAAAAPVYINQAPAAPQKEKGSWGCLIGWVVIFWPVAIIYYLQRRWD